eukprot:CAMPEP_0198140074 /NCGR_PEP_ID=MMETSP1443-20131203/3288_1 /TAXON_ID=186043 /ORGANISM="Entomoneis sp., Strain CCMP2396" /LENGTH=33 /DNA_ID= /DNA_START= /DNA_END= /DNA_ORIENTATION=
MDNGKGRKRRITIVESDHSSEKKKKQRNSRNQP